MIEPRSWNHSDTDPVGLQERRLEAALGLLSQASGRILEVGARDGRMTRRLRARFPDVVALDLERPGFHIDGVTTLQGDVAALPFADLSFDIVVCTEVLEHVPRLRRACSDLARVTRNHLLVGVPFDQDTRVGRMTCVRCNQPNPPWGHVNSFSRATLLSLFPGLRPVAVDYVGWTNDRTNWLSCFLMDLARNPWGTYSQQEACVHCGAELVPPERLSLLERSFSWLAARLYRLQRQLTRPRPIWIHVLFCRAPLQQASGTGNRL